MTARVTARPTMAAASAGVLRRRSLLVAGAAVLVTSCRKPATGGPLVVLAAASLREVLTELCADFTRASGVAVTPTFDATSRLARQLAEGAIADVFVSADEAWMDDLAGKSLIAPDTRVDVAASELVAIVRRDGGLPLRSVDELRDVKRLAVAGENVPAGRYARAALRSAGVWSAVESKLASGESVRVALEWVASGEAEAGIVYASDPRVEPRVRVAFTFPPDGHEPIRYPAAVLRGARRADDARAFVKRLVTPEARRVFAEAGFRAP